MPDADGLLFEINGIAFQTHNLAAAQTVESTDDDGKLQRITFHSYEQYIQFFFVIDGSFVFDFTLLLHSICWIGFNQANLECILQTLSYIGMTADHRGRGKP